MTVPPALSRERVLAHRRRARADELAPVRTVVGDAWVLDEDVSVRWEA